MKKFISMVIVGTMMFTGCSSSSNDIANDTANDTAVTETSEETAEDDASELSDTITIVDHDGVEVTLDRNLERVVVASLNPMPSLLSLFLGSGETVVGMNNTSYDAVSKGIMAELFPELLDADTSFYQGSDINIEQLLKLDPQVVIIISGDAELRSMLENAGLTVVAFGVGNWDYSIVDTFANWIDLLCDMYPDQENTINITDYSNEIIDLVQSRVSELSEDEIKDILFLFQYDENSIRTSGQKFFGQYWSETVGANNVAGENEGGNIEITMEQVYSWEPDTIFISNFTTAQPEDLYNNAIGSEDWSLVPAVENSEVYKMPLGSYRTYSVSAEMPVVLLWMAQKTYPDLFEDINIVEEMIDFYSMAFGIEITETQAKKILYLGN